MPFRVTGMPEEMSGEQRIALRSVVAVVCVVGAVAFALGIMLGSRGGVSMNAGSLLGSEKPPPDIDLAPVWKAWRTIDEKFVPASVASSSSATSTSQTQKRVWGMIQGLASSLDDPYTYFLPPVEQKQFTDDMSGSFEGVGMEIAVRDQVLTVVSPLKGNPAERAGIKAGDKILKIDDADTRGMDISEAVNHIRGPKGSTVTLLVLREGWIEPRKFDVKRDVINVPIVTTKQLPSGVYVIQVSTFTANAPTLFRDALREFVASGSSKLIIDLRGNPGGYLDAAVSMASWFLGAGKTVVTEDYAGHQHNIVHRSLGYDIFNDSLKMVILVDRGSASASEILALALHDWGKATLVGEHTFGKGSVQELVDITPDTSLKLTVARWLGPHGEHIPTTGISVDVSATTTEEDIKAGKDPQMDRAAAYLINGF